MYILATGVVNRCHERLIFGGCVERAEAYAWYNSFARSAGGLAGNMPHYSAAHACIALWGKFQRLCGVSSSLRSTSARVLTVQEYADLTYQ